MARLSEQLGAAQEAAQCGLSELINQLYKLNLTR